MNQRLALALGITAGLRTFSWDLHLLHLLRRLQKHRSMGWLQCLSSLDNCTAWDRLRSEKYQEGPGFHWGLEVQLGRSHLASLEYHWILEVRWDLVFYLCSLSIGESNNLAVLSLKSGPSLKPLRCLLTRGNIPHLHSPFRKKGSLYRIWKDLLKIIVKLWAGSSPRHV